jgi:hypothetical protein
MKKITSPKKNEILDEIAQPQYELPGHPAQVPNSARFESCQPKQSTNREHGVVLTDTVPVNAGDS